MHGTCFGVGGRPVLWLLALIAAGCGGTASPERTAAVDAARWPDPGDALVEAGVELADLGPRPDRSWPTPDLSAPDPRDATLPPDSQPAEDGGAAITDAGLPEADLADPRERYAEVPLQPSPAFLSRQAAFLDACAQAAAPGVGRSRDGQVCRVALGLPVDPVPLQEAAARVQQRVDTADFAVATLVRVLFLDRETRTLAPEQRAQLEQTVLGFKYWLDEPGQDRMCYWSENHQILFHSAELLAGTLFPDEVFPNDGRTGAEHAAHAEPLVERWLELRGRLGFSEWHSNVYFNEDIPALVNLADFAPSEAIRTRAALILDLLAFELLGHTFAGYLATVHGRTYESHTVGGLRDSTREAAWLLTGLGDVRSPTNFSGAFLATSRGYFPPPLLEDAAVIARDRHARRQRDGIDVVAGPAWGIGYDDPADVVRWAGMVALGAPEVIEGTAAMLDAYELWDGFLFGDLPDSVLDLIRTLRRSGSLVQVATELEPVSRGIALQALSTYTWRTPHYQLSGAQDYHPGSFGAQTHSWQATLDGEAYVFTSFACQTEGLDESGEFEFGTAWIGCWQPRATFFRNVGVIQYVRPVVPLLDAFVQAPYTHAYFPRAAFDEVRVLGPWTFGRQGLAYVALWSELPAAWAPDSDFDLVAADGPVNRYVVELGSRAEFGSFERFVTQVRGAPIEVTEGRVVYESPSVGRVEVGWEGPLTVAGQAVDLGPYPRWDDRFVRQEFGSTVTELDVYGRRLRLDLAAPARQTLATVIEPPPFEACEPATPAAVCYAARRDPAAPQVELARGLARRWVAEHPPTTLDWDWEEAVLLLGLLELTRVTGEREWQDYAQTWLDHWIARGSRITTPDTVVPAAVAVALHGATGEPAYRQVVEDALRFLFEQVPRDGAGGVNHLGLVDDGGITLWIDSLFMLGAVLLRWGEQTGDPRVLHEWAAQFEVQRARLQAPGGLFTHAYNWVLPQDPDVFWARGNGWITASGYDYLRLRRQRGERDPAVRAALARQVDAVRGAQDPATGLWWTVLTRPGELYLETSASALFAYGLARGWRSGYLPDDVLPAIRRAMTGIASRIRPDEQGRPVVTGTSGPTNPGSFTAYAVVPQRDDLPYGVGAVLLALLETAGLPEE